MFTLASLTFGFAGAEEPIVHTVDFPKGDAAWGVLFQVDPAAATPKSAPGLPDAEAVPLPRQRKKMDIVRQGQLRHDLVTWSNSSVTEYWWSDKAGFVVYQDLPDGRINTLKTGNLQDQRYDNSLFDWVKAGTFMDLRTFHGKKCRYYETEIILPDEEKQTLRAWIDNESQKPVAWTNSGILSIFSFDVPMPVQPLVMPEKFQKAIDRLMAYSVFRRKPETR